MDILKAAGSSCSLFSSQLMGSYTANDVLRLIEKCFWRSGEMDEPDYRAETWAVQLLREVNPIKATSANSCRFSRAALGPG